MDNSDEDLYGGIFVCSFCFMMFVIFVSVIRGYFLLVFDVLRMLIKRVIMVDSGMMIELVDVCDFVEFGVFSDGEGLILVLLSVIYIEWSCLRMMEFVIIC